MAILGHTLTSVRKKECLAMWWFVLAVGLAGLVCVLVGFGLMRIGITLAGGVLVALALLATAIHVSQPPETLPLDPNPSSSFKIVALGDSYISGEGARRYFPGTDEGGKRANLCHRAATAYPYLAAKALGASLTFISCSGARARDVTGRDAAGDWVGGQYERSDPAVFGRRPQLAELREVEDPDAILISIGGNDAGFAEIGAQCATPELPDCRRAASFWLRRLEDDVYPALVRTFRAVRQVADRSDATVFAFTYPDPIGPGYCPDIALSLPEMRFVRDVFVGRLNRIVEAAAGVARVRVIDLTHAVDGYRFCEKPLGQTAVNFVELEHTNGSHVSFDTLGSVAHGTLHPNPLGHRLIEKRVLKELIALRTGKLAPLPPPPPPDERPPHFDPGEVDSPRPVRFPSGTSCPGPPLVAVSPMSTETGVRQVSLSGLRPRSTVCFRPYLEEWRSTRADSHGDIRVPVDVSRAGVASVNEILAEQRGGEWRKVVVSRLGAADEGQFPGSPSKSKLHLLLAAIFLAIVGLVILLRVSRPPGASWQW
jgi:lysophospholipase L1-like esterase